MDEISQREYEQEVRSIAESVRADAKEYGEAENERLWETIDGHQWVIYTFYNYQVLMRSQNDGYAVEQFGADSVVKDGVLNTAALAFGALYADVLEALSELPEDGEGE